MRGDVRGARSAYERTLVLARAVETRARLDPGGEWDELRVGAAEASGEATTALGRLE